MLSTLMAGFGKKSEKRNKKSQAENRAHGEALYKNALDHHIQGDLINAEKAYKEAISTGYLNEILFSNLGVICKNSGRPEEAIILYKKAIEQNHNYPDAYSNLGNLYKDLGNLAQALAFTLKSVELNPNNPYAHFNLGGIYKDLGNLDQALASTRKSLELDPNNPTAHMNLGGIYKELGNLDQALTSTLKSLELKPDNPDAHITLGSIYFERNEYKKAEEEVSLAINLNAPKLDICYRLKAACLFQKEHYNEAMDLLKKLSLKSAFTGKSLWETQIALRANDHAKKHAARIEQRQKSNDLLPSAEEKEIKDLIIMKNRPVNEDLLLELHNVESKKLSETEAIDARNGDGQCTNFELFNSNLPAIKQLSADLSAIASEALSKDICSLRYDSFFNIFKSGAGARPHAHLRRSDMRFNLWRHKYSLVYYLDPGDQDCENPGILKMYDPDIQILPKKGMILIFPSTRMHSSYYEGTKNRLMIGVNFYAFCSNQYP